MTCSNCSFQNKAGAAFCGRCGEKLATLQSQLPVASGAVAAQPQKARQFCGKCGSELRAGGSCLRCSVPSNPRHAYIADPGGAALTFNVPKIPTRTGVLVLGAICALGIVIFAGKALWGESLLVRTNVPGATVFVDGKERGRIPVDGVTPLSLDHLHGEQHTVIVKADGYRDAAANIKFPNRLTTPLMLYLAARPSGIRVHALPGSSILLNGRFFGRAGGDGFWSAPNLQPAGYSVTVRQQGYLDWSHAVALKPGDEESLSADQREAPLTPEQQQAKAMALLNKANQEMLAGQLPAALTDCQASVEAGAGQQATDLCERIQKILTITNGGAK